MLKCSILVLVGVVAGSSLPCSQGAIACQTENRVDGGEGLPSGTIVFP